MDDHHDRVPQVSQIEGAADQGLQQGGDADQRLQQVEGVCTDQGEQKVCNLFVVYTLLIRFC